MPLTRISLRKGRSAADHQALLDGVYQAMRATFDVPEDDRFMMIHEHAADDFAYGAHYMGIERTDELVMIQITCNEGRTVAKKRALYAAIVENLTRAPGLRPEDVFINLVEVKPENWSFGHGLAQYAKGDD
jgi:phenylpyruvate tautomerase PptA (4-oxalocrotonate tautomerase family)